MPRGRPIARLRRAAPTPFRRGPGEAGSAGPSCGRRAEAQRARGARLRDPQSSDPPSGPSVSGGRCRAARPPAAVLGAGGSAAASAGPCSGI